MRLLPALLLGLACAALAGAAPPKPERIGFVELRFTAGGAVEVVSAEAVPGRLKRRRGRAVPPPGAVAVEVEAGGVPVWTGAIADPLARRRESVDATGRLETRVERVDEATVTVRVPAVASRQTLAFWRPTASGRGAVTRVEVSL